MNDTMNVEEIPRHNFKPTLLYHNVNLYDLLDKYYVYKTDTRFYLVISRETVWNNGDYYKSYLLDDYTATLYGSRYHKDLNHEWLQRYFNEAREYIRNDVIDWITGLVIR